MEKLGLDPGPVPELQCSLQSNAGGLMPDPEAVQNLKLKCSREGLGFLFLHPCSTHTSKAPLETSSGSYLNT